MAILICLPRERRQKDEVRSTLPAFARISAATPRSMFGFTRSRSMMRAKFGKADVTVACKVNQSATSHALAPKDCDDKFYELMQA